MVPVIDLHSPPELSAKNIAAACAEGGIFHVVNHGVDAKLIAALQDACQIFFGLPLNSKQAVSRTIDNPFGYYDRELTKNLRDCKEIFDFAPGGTTPWPSEPAGFQATLENYAAASQRLAIQLMAVCCKGLNAAHDSLRSHFQQGHSSFLRLNHYPTTDLLPGADVPPAGPHGISQHSDAGALTILLQDDVTGLEALIDGRWIDVTPVPEALTINIGDMLQVWSNDQYCAPLHRVRASDNRARDTAAFFYNPDHGTVVEPLPAAVSTAKPALYEPISWDEFRRMRAMGDFGDFGEEIQISHFRRQLVARRPRTHHR